MLFETLEDELRKILEQHGVIPTDALIDDLEELARDKESESSIDAVRDYSERND